MTSSVQYLSIEEVLRLHDSSISKWGGAEGLRDRGALESSLAQPKMEVFGTERFAALHEKAAAYCYFIARNHPFVDGNKRTATAAAFVFLVINGIVPRFDSDDAYHVINRAASGECNLDELSRFFERSIQPWH